MSATIGQRLMSLTYAELMSIAREAKNRGRISFTKPWTEKKGIFWVSYRRSYPKAILVKMLAKNAKAIEDLPSFRNILGKKTKPPDMSSLQCRLFPGVVGLADLKRALIERIYLPFTDREGAVAYGLSLAPGILLYGPPGNGKTFAVQRFCEQCGFSFHSLTATALMSKWFGQSEAQIRELFANAQRQRPAIIFIDEVDAIMPSRDKVQAEFGHVQEFLVQLDGARKRDFVAVIGATNRPEALDFAIRRAGRLDIAISVDNPVSPAERHDLFEAILEGRPRGNVDLESPARLTEGASRADIAAIVKEAAAYAFFRKQTAKSEPKVTQADLLRAIEQWKQRLLINHNANMISVPAEESHTAAS